MSKFAARLLTLVMFVVALTAVPLLTAAHAAGGDNPSPPAPPASDSSKEKKKNDNSSSIDDPRFIEGYRPPPTRRFTSATIVPRRSDS